MKKFKVLFTLLTTVTFALAGSLASAAIVTSLAGHVELAPLAAVPIFGLLLVTDFKLPKYAFSDPIIFTEGICEKIQTSLIDLMGVNSPERKRTPVGYLQAVTSATNQAGFNVIPIDQHNGKKRSVRVTYAQRGTDADIVDEITNGCSADISKTPFEDIVDINREIATQGIVFSEDEMRKLCESDQTWIARIINAEFDALLVRLNKRMIAVQNANFGDFADGTNTVHTRQLLKTADKSAYYYGENQILNDFSDIDFPGRPILIGNGILRDYTRIVSHGCCNAQGLDVGTVGEFDYYQDRHVAGILGNANDFIGLAPGHVQFIQWNKYVGSYAKNYGNIIKTTIMDPYTGILFDINWKYDDCDEVWILTLSLHWDMYFMPSNIFAAGDPLEGVNYTLHYRASES